MRYMFCGLFCIMLSGFLQFAYAESDDLFNLRVSTEPNILFLNGGGYYSQDELVTIGKAPEEWKEYVFLGWKVDGVWTSDNPVTVRMDGNHRAVAIYEKKNHGSVTIDAIPRVAQITVDGTIYLPTELPLALSFPMGSEHRVSIQSTILEDPNTRYVFDKWKDVNSDLSRVIKIEKDVDLTALFKTQYFLKPISEFGIVRGEGWVDAGSKAEFEIPSEVVVDKRDDNTRYVFDKWDMGYKANSPKNIVDMKQPMTVAATWDRQYRLDLVSTVPDVHLVGSGWYDESKTVTIMAEEELDSPRHDVKYVFDKWVSKGANAPAVSDPTSPILIIPMDDSYLMEARYKKSYLVDVWSPFGAASGGGYYEDGSTAEISISTLHLETEPNKIRKTFAGWDYQGNQVKFDGQDEIGNQNLMILVEKPINVTAKWKTQYYLDAKSDNSDVSGSGWYDVGHQAAISASRPSASPSFWASYSFLGWSGDYDAKSQSAKVLMNGPKFVRAMWKEDPTPGIVNGMLLSGVAAGGMVVYAKTKRKRPEDRKSNRQEKLEAFSNKNRTEQQKCSGPLSYVLRILNR